MAVSEDSCNVQPASARPYSSSAISVFFMIPAPGSIPVIVQSTSSPNSSFAVKSSISSIPYSSTTYCGTVSASGAWSTKTAISSKSSWRSEEHTSELQSRFDIVCRLLLEIKKQEQKLV